MAKSRSTRTVKQAAPKPSQLVVESSVKVDVQLSVDNIAEIPAGEFEDRLDDMREELQKQMAQLTLEREEITNKLSQEATALVTAYVHKPSAALVTAMGAFIGEPYDSVVEAESCDLEESVVKVSVTALAAVDKAKYLELKGKGSEKSYSYGSSYSNFPEIKADVDLPFNSLLSGLKVEKEVISTAIAQLSAKLVKVESAYSKLPKLRERAKRAMTTAVLKGQLQTNDDVLNFISEIAPNEMSKLPNITQQQLTHNA